MEEKKVNCKDCIHNSIYICWYGYTKYEFFPKDPNTNIPKRVHPRNKDDKNSDGDCEVFEMTIGCRFGNWIIEKLLNINFK